MRQVLAVEPQGSQYVPFKLFQLKVFSSKFKSLLLLFILRDTSFQIFNIMLKLIRLFFAFFLSCFVFFLHNTQSNFILRQFITLNINFINNHREKKRKYVLDITLNLRCFLISLISSSFASILYFNPSASINIFLNISLASVTGALI